MALFLVAVLALSGLAVTASKGAAASKHLTTAATLAQDTLEQVRSTGYDAGLTAPLETTEAYNAIPDFPLYQRVVRMQPNQSRSRAANGDGHGVVGGRPTLRVRIHDSCTLENDGFHARDQSKRSHLNGTADSLGTGSVHRWCGLCGAPESGEAPDRSRGRVGHATNRSCRIGHDGQGDPHGRLRSHGGESGYRSLE